MQGDCAEFGAPKWDEPERCAARTAPGSREAAWVICIAGHAARAGSPENAESTPWNPEQQHPERPGWA